MAHTGWKDMGILYDFVLLVFFSQLSIIYVTFDHEMSRPEKPISFIDLANAFHALLGLIKSFVCGGWNIVLLSTWNQSYKMEMKLWGWCGNVSWMKQYLQWHMAPLEQNKLKLQFSTLQLNCNFQAPGSKLSASGLDFTSLVCIQVGCSHQSPS